MTGFPLPGTAAALVAVPAPAPGAGNWAGAPSAALDDDAGVVLRGPHGTWDARGARVTAVPAVGRIAYEAPLADGSRELRTELVA